MVYCFGKETETGNYNVLVDVTGAGKKLEILSDVGDRVVDLENCRLKYFEEVVQEILKGFPNSSKVFLTDEASKIINEVTIQNRRRYYNHPRVRFELAPMAPAMCPV